MTERCGARGRHHDKGTTARQLNPCGPETRTAMPCNECPGVWGPIAIAVAVLVPTLLILLLVAGITCWQKGMCTWARVWSGCCHVPCLTAVARKMGIAHAPMQVATLILTWTKPAAENISRREMVPSSPPALVHSPIEDVQSSQDSHNPLNAVIPTAESSETVVSVATPNYPDKIPTMLAQERARRHENSRQRINSAEFFHPPPGAGRSRSKSSQLPKQSHSKKSKKISISRKSFHLVQTKVDSRPDILT